MFRSLFFIFVIFFGGFYGYNNFVHVKPGSFAGISPELNIRKFFNGHLHAYGYTQDITGRTLNQFNADITGKWKGNRGKITHITSFSNGDDKSSDWKIKFTKTSDFIAQADDIAGNASGTQNGNIANIKYQSYFSIMGMTILADYNEWLHYLKDDHLVSEVTISKFGIPIGKRITVYNK